MNQDSVLPNSAEFEQCALGAFLAGAKDSECVLNLRPEHFFVDAHRKIFSAIVAVGARGNKPDLLTLHDELQQHGGLSEIGGIAYLSKLTDGIPHITAVAQWVSKIRALATRREIIGKVATLQQRAFEGEDEPSKLLDAGIELLSVMARDLEDSVDDGVTYRDAAVQLLSDLHDKSLPRLLTGLYPLDAVLGGFLPGELWVFAAATGTGKTVLAQQVRRRACARGHHVLYCSGEMTAKHLQARELAGAAGVLQGKMRQNEKLTEAEFAQLADAAAVQCNTCKIIGGNLELIRIRQAARRMKARTGLSLIVFDYDELVEVEDAQNEMEQLRLLARAAKSLAIELDCVVVLISQLRKALEGDDLERPTLQLIYGNAAKAKFSTGALIVHRPYVQKLEGSETDATVFVLKNRDGRLGRVDCRFNVQTLEFLESEFPAEPERTSDHESRTRSLPFDGKMRAAGNGH
jgi:replicative DNA helicase